MGGAMFPKKSDEPDARNDSQDAPPIQIERSDDGSLGKTTTNGSLPNTQMKKIGCGSAVFALMLVVAIVFVGSAAI